MYEICNGDHYDHQHSHCGLQLFKEISEFKILDEFRGLESVTSAGISYQDYSQRVLDTKIVIDRTLKETPQPSTKDELAAIMDCYVAAKNYWAYSIQEPDAILLPEDIANNCKRFGAILPISVGAKSEYVSEFWEWASKHIKTVEEQLKK